MVRFKIATVLCRWLLRIAGLVMMVAGCWPASMPMLHLLPRSWRMPTADLCSDLRDTFTVFIMTYLRPAAQWTGYQLETPIDWHLVIVGVLITVAARPLGVAATWLSYPLSMWILRQRIKITFTSDVVLIHRRGRTIKLPRRGAGAHPITFQSVALQTFRPRLMQVLRLSSAQPVNGDGPQAALVVYGFRRIELIAPRNLRRAQQVVAACHYAAKQAHPHQLDLSKG